jgi:glycosyltransferase involved in cell wall biosynthesis
MRILLFTSDKTLFDDESKSLRDLIKAAEVSDIIHVVVLTKFGDKLENKSIAGKIFLYPTNSLGDLNSVREAIKIASFQTVISGKIMVDLVIADDPFFAGLAAHFMSRRHKVNYLLNVYESLDASLVEDKGFKLWKKVHISKYILPKCHGIRVFSQAVGESLNADFKDIEDKIYVLDLPLETGEEVKVEEEKDFNIKTKYPQFNLFVVTVVDTKNNTLLKRINTIGVTLRMRYPRIGVIVIDNQGLYKHVPSEVVVWEKGVRDLVSYYRGAHIYIDLSNETKTGRAITEAALTGCPIVAAESPASTFIVVPGENGFIANPDNPPEFCGRIAEIFETPGLKEKIRMFRHEVNQMTVRTVEEYGPSLLGIWQRVRSKHVMEEDSEDKIEKAAVGLVHTLKDTRAFVGKVAEKIDKDLAVAKDKLNFEDGKRRKPLHQVDIHDDTKAFDVDTVIKNI